MVRAIHPLDEECAVNTEHSLGKGALNLNASSEYVLALVLESVIEGVDIEGAGGRLLSSAKENRVVLTEWKRQTLVYGAEGTSKSLLEESEPLTGILEPNAAVQLFIPVSMMSPSGAEEVRRRLKAATPPPGEPAPPLLGAELLVRFQIHGKLMSTGKKLKTAPIDFPIFAYLGEPLPVCSEEQELAPVGPCGLYGGQDGFIPICCELDSVSRKCKSN